MASDRLEEIKRRWAQIGEDGLEDKPDEPRHTRLGEAFDDAITDIGWLVPQLEALQAEVVQLRSDVVAYRRLVQPTLKMEADNDK